MGLFGWAGFWGWKCLMFLSGFCLINAVCRFQEFLSGFVSGVCFIVLDDRCWGKDTLFLP